MSMNVPPEIIDHIFSFLKSDPTTLEKCSRTHPILSAPAERFLYADIVVYDDGRFNHDEDDCRHFHASDLHKLLTNFPYIANYIHKLEIRLSHAKGIAPILPMLWQLSSISVTPSSNRVWTNLPAEFCDVFMNCLCSSHSAWKEVSVSCANFPLRVFDDCKTVKSITLYGFAGLDENDLQVMPHLVLESLSLRDWITTTSRFLDWTRNRIHDLRSLVLDSAYPLVINKILVGLVGVCSNALTSLEMSINRGFRTRFATNGTILYPGEKISLDLSSVPCLKDLIIHATIDIRCKDYYYSAVPAILALLRTTPHLLNLTLEFFIDPFSDLNLINWSHLFTFLSHSSDKFLHIGLHLSATKTLAGHVIPSVDTLPQLDHSEIVSDMMAKGILDISMEEWKGR